ncbi:MAG TPA: hypothetical protein VLY63_05505, partial [Anaerolineae bacterium]|nr:hypothetical protein [Anaerolineae bacterium]
MNGKQRISAYLERYKRLRPQRGHPRYKHVAAGLSGLDFTPPSPWVPAPGYNLGPRAERQPTDGRRMMPPRTMREKMLAGERYNILDPELETIR